MSHKHSPDLFTVAQRFDFGLAVLSAAAAVYLAIWEGAYGLAAIVGLGSVISFASAKYMPAKWLIRRFLLARTR